ncbi:MAG: hypothetical protein HDT41_00615, partial [Lachnospiraceae bacterium]|nr:hypothetical protein [Lachnospiraceae bacterium]
RVLIEAFRDEENNNTIPGLKKKVSQRFLEGEYLPDQNDVYKSVADSCMAVPFGIADFLGKHLFETSFKGISGFVAFNNAKEANFTEYFNWLTNVLHIRTFTLDKWAEALLNMEEQQILSEEKNVLNLFYKFLFDNRESGNLMLNRGGFYETMIKNVLGGAWNNLKKAPIILNADNILVPAYKGITPNVYLGSSSIYKSLVSSSIVNAKIAEEFERLLKDGFEIAEFDNFQYLKEKIIKKYIKVEGEDIAFDDFNNFEKEYVEDIKQILRYLEETHNTEEMQKILKDAYIIKIKSDEDGPIFNKPGCVHTDISDEGIDLNVYYASIPYEEEFTFDEDDADDEGCWEYTYWGFDYDSLDTDFYVEHEIPIKKLQWFGLVTSAVNEGVKTQEGIGNKQWRALGEYCPEIEFDGIEDNCTYIKYHSDEELAQKKSAEILKLFLNCTEKFVGKVRRGKRDSCEVQEKCSFLKDGIYRYKWLISKNGEVVNQKDISKYDLDTNIYGTINPNKEKYKILGFKETADDNKAEAFEMVGALDKRDKEILLKQLARELGMQEITNFSREDVEFSEELTFDPSTWISSEFPIHKVRNMDSLIRHVREEFFCADPVKYQKVLRQIRVSKSSRAVRSYSLGMYTNENNIHICQMCKKPAQFVDVTEIANYGIELPTLYLCLCKNCSGKYKSIRDSKKDEFKKEMKRKLENADFEYEAAEYEIVLNSEISIFFTQTHLAETRELLLLIDKYGLPDNDMEPKEEEFKE